MVLLLVLLTGRTASLFRVLWQADQTEKGDESHAYPAISITDLPAGDRNNVLLLILLYFLQGVPFGLIAGSLPFLLKRYLSFSEVCFLCFVAPRTRLVTHVRGWTAAGILLACIVPVQPQAAVVPGR
jgi:hypothetical protein